MRKMRSTRRTNRLHGVKTDREHTLKYDGMRTTLVYSLVTASHPPHSSSQKTSLCCGTASACSLPWLTCSSEQRTATRLVHRLVSRLVRRLVSGLVSS